MDLFKLVGTIAIENAEANKAIDETTDKAGKSEGKFKKFFGGIGKASLAVGKAVAVGIGAVASGLAVLSGKAMSEYANYEQLVGGVETLFKDSKDKVIQYANEAYKTAGMSANEYMETVTGFSASLLQSLGGDTEKASEKANQAVIDMSDNANKMGTDIQSIQYAYQGFAKQNYTMLDNLKLGYGGTREEMQRLLTDAEKISGIHYDISSFSDITDAIHVIQTELDITGTTAKEASSTIQGSIGMLKSAWTNFLTGMADPTQDFDSLVKNLIDSFITVTENIIPRLTMMLPRLIEGLASVIQALSEEIPAMVEALLPAFINGAVTLIQALVDVLPALIQVLVQTVPLFLDGIIQIINAIVQALPEIITLITNVLPTLVVQIVNALIEALPILIQGSITLILALVEALPQIISALVDAIPQVVAKLVDTILQNLPQFVVGATKLVWGIVKAIPQIIGSLLMAIPSIIAGIVKGFVPLGGKLVEKATSGLNAVKNVFVNKFNNIKEVVRGAIDKIKSFFHFNWSLPKLKLPHPSISGKFSLAPPSVPHFSLDWYDKAMENGMIMNEPTIFGYNDATKQLMAGGESGSETVVGTNSLMMMIKDAVASTNQGIIAVLNAIMRILETFFPELIDSMNFQMILDTGVLVGETAELMDEELGMIYKRKGRM